MVMIRIPVHIGITVNDMDVSTGFYRKVCGPYVSNDEEQKGEWVLRITGKKDFILVQSV
jgi:hypothetical protein